MEIKTILNENTINPEDINDYFLSKNSPLLNQKQKSSNLLLRPSISIQSLMNISFNTEL